jgi:hydrogenase maturation protease
MKYLIGMGNYSMGDDGIGLRITEHISDNMLDDGFEAVEVANNGMQLLTYFDDNTEKLLIVDAVKFGGKPGEHIFFSPEDVKTQKVVGTISTHEGDILKLISMAEQLDLPMPNIRILGIEPESMTPDAVLSEPLKANFNGYIEAVIAELKD